MEAHGVREFPPDSLRGRFVRRALQAAVVDVILPAFAEQVLELAAARPAAEPRPRRARDRLPAGPHPLRDRRPGRPRPAARELWRAVLGERRPPRARRPVRQGRVDPRRRARAARRGGPRVPARSSASPTRHRAPAGPASRSDPAKAGERRSRRRRRRRDAGDGARRGVARRRARAGDRERPRRPARAARRGRRPRAGARATPPPAASERGKLGRGRGTGLPTGRMPDRGVDRPPYPDEVQHARRYANRLRQAITHGTRQIDKRTPGGRFDGRAYARGRAEQAAGRPVTTHPWRVTRQVAAPIQEPHVGLIIDTSGSMGGYEYALGPIAWILTDGLRQIGGRCATALFGNSAALLADGTRPLPLVPGIRTGGGTAFAGDAIELVSDQLEMTNPRRPRFVYVLSDGGWSDTRAGVERIRRLAELGVPTIHLIDRDRAAVGRVRPHHRDHRPRAGARPHRRRHRRRARRPPPPPARPLTNLSPKGSNHDAETQPCPAAHAPPCSTSPPSPTTPLDGRIERVALERARARRQRAPRDLPRGDRAARRRC